MKKGFTLIELVVSVSLLVVVLTFSSLIFKVSVGSYRLAQANAEIMRNLRAISDQLNSDFAGFQKDGYLIIQSKIISQFEFKDSPAANDFRSDRIYYFSTGDYQSWFPDYPQSNIARICWGHDLTSEPASQWRLGRNVTLLACNQTIQDCNNISFSKCKVSAFENRDSLLDNPATINLTIADGIRQLMCQNVGEFKIEWTDGATYEYLDPKDNQLKRPLAWFGLGKLRSIDNSYPGIAGNTEYNVIENADRATWTPVTSRTLLPRAVKFTFTLYDSKGVIKNGRIFTHIVYIDR
jgi:prepilin-type N-terminal cleavage/methylation domain-containing protein